MQHIDPSDFKERFSTAMLTLRLLRDGSGKNSFATIAAHIVNNSRLALPYDRSTLLNSSGKIISAFATPQVSNTTDHAKKLRKVLKKHRDGGETKIGEIYYFIIPLKSVRHKVSQKRPYYWIIEFPEPLSEHFRFMLNFMIDAYGQLLWSFKRISQLPGLIGKFFKWTFFLALLAAIVVACIKVEINNNIAAEFVIKPKNSYSVYALFDCVVKQGKVPDGAMVKNNEQILSLDTERIRFQLSAAEAAYRELVTEYEQEQQAAFTDRERLPRLKILDLKKEQATIAIDEAKWYLERSIVKANADGIIAFPEGSADKIVGRALRVGDRFFEIAGTDGIIAEVMIDQKDSSILMQNPQVTLYLHTQPDAPIAAKIISVRNHAELTERNTYCYKVKCEFNDHVPDLRLGMRGITRISGEQVTLGYYLFRSIVLWWRGV